MLEVIMRKMFVLGVFIDYSKNKDRGVDGDFENYFVKNCNLVKVLI